MRRVLLAPEGVHQVVVPRAVQQVHAGLRFWAALRDEVVHVDLHPTAAAAACALAAAAPGGQAAVEIHDPDGHLQGKWAGAGAGAGAGRGQGAGRARAGSRQEMSAGEQASRQATSTSMEAGVELCKSPRAPSTSIPASATNRPQLACRASVRATSCTWSLSSPMGSTHLEQKVATSRSLRPCAVGEGHTNTQTAVGSGHPGSRVANWQC